MHSFFSIADKVAIVTGGSSGIGKATAERFSRAGASVIVAARGDATEFAKGIGATFIKTDVSNEADVKNMVGQVVEMHGRIDVLVSNAGFFGNTIDLTEKNAAEFQRCFDVNTFGTFYAIKHCAPHMSSGSSIICTTSLASIIGLPGYSDYTASKWATSGIVRCAAMELGAKGIRVNEVCPSSTNTPMLMNQDSAQAEIALTTTAAAIGNLVEPEELAALIHFVAASDCPTLTGQRIAIDGGISAGFSGSAINAILTAKGFA
ncbi:SDR family oxidoreductase [Paraburkholderia sp. SIMBA_049]